MDKRFFSDLWNKRRSAWTFGLCLAGVLAIGSIVALDKVQRTEEVQPETTMEQAYLEDEELFDDAEEVNDTLISALEEENNNESAAAANSGEVQENADSLSEVTDHGIAAGDTEEQLDAAAQAGLDGNAAVADEAMAEASSSNIISEESLLAANVAFDESDTLLWPAAGSILIDYSMDGSVYFPTLNQYKYSPALVIGSETGNQVLSAARGIVESLKTDEVTGLTMTVNIGNGYRLTYGQLKEAAVQEGDVVETGSLLGYVSEPTRYYTKEGSNLYFQMTQNNTPVDPILYLE